MKVYQLTVTGRDDAFGGESITWHSKVLFRTVTGAEKALPRWIERLEREDVNAIRQINYREAKTHICELDLEDDPPVEF